MPCHTRAVWTVAKKLLAQGVAAETPSVTRREEQVIVVFLMNLHARCGKFPGEFRRELRRVMLRELASWAGLEVDFGDEAPAAQLPTSIAR